MPAFTFEKISPPTSHGSVEPSAKNNTATNNKSNKKQRRLIVQVLDRFVEARVKKSLRAEPTHRENAVACPVSETSNCRQLELEADYLYWWIRRPTLNTPLLTSGVPGATGVVGDPNTFVVVGNGEKVPYDGQSGFRVGATLWLGDASRLGINLNGFALSRTSGGSRFASDATGSPVIAQPIMPCFRASKG